MTIFELEIKVNQAHLDTLQHVNNVVYVDWIQQIAGAHWQNTSPKEVQEAVVWVVHRHEIDYLKPALSGDILRGLTWVEAMEGLTSLRRVQIKRGDTLLVDALTRWVMLDAKTHRPKRISPELAQLFMEM
jgi:acyl-CoA thioester hydrolase